MRRMLPIAARDISFRTFARNTALGRIYLDTPARADGPDVDQHVVLDDNFAAAEKGVSEEAGTAKFYLLVQS